MRSAFEAWAQRDGHIVRRREDKPEEYLVYETQRRWVIWQAALEHGKAPAGRKTAAKDADKPAAVRAGGQRPPVIEQDQAAVRNQVLNEVLAAFMSLDGESGMDDIRKVIQDLRMGSSSQPASASLRKTDSKAAER